MSEERGFDYNQLIGPGIGAGAAFLGSIPQMVEARRLKKERERLLKEGAPGMTAIEDAQIAAARARAASGLAPGYAQEMENNAELTSNLLGAGKKAGITGSNAMNLLSRLNQQGQAARRNLAARGAQAQRVAQGDYTNISMTADAKRQGRVRDWENDLSEMDARRRQYNAAVGMAPLQGAISFMPVEGFKSGTGALKPTKPTAESNKFNPEKDIQIGDEMNPSGVRMAPAMLTPDANMIGRHRMSQFNMAEDIGYDPIKEPLRQYPTLKKIYDNAVTPNAAAKRAQVAQKLGPLVPGRNRPIFMTPQASDMGGWATPINTENFHYPESPGKPPIKNGAFGKTVFRYDDLGNPEVFFPNGRARGNRYGVNPYEFPYKVNDSGYILRDPR